MYILFYNISLFFKNFYFKMCQLCRLGAQLVKHITKFIEVKWHLRNGKILKEDRGAVIVSNHQSSLDILGMALLIYFFFYLSFILHIVAKSVRIYCKLEQFSFHNSEMKIFHSAKRFSQTLSYCYSNHLSLFIYCKITETKIDKQWV